MADINIKNVDKESKRKAIFYLGTKGKDLSTAVREMLEKYAKEFDEMLEKYAKEYDEMQKNNS